MNLSELTPQQQGQLAVAVAEILTRGLTTSAEIDAVSFTLAAVRDNVLLYGIAIKKKTAMEFAAINNNLKRKKIFVKI